LDLKPLGLSVDVALSLDAGHPYTHAVFELDERRDLDLEIRVLWLVESEGVVQRRLSWDDL